MKHTLVLRDLELVLGKTTTMRTEPLALGLFGESHALIMEPLILAVVVIAPDHLTVADFLTDAVQVLVVTFVIVGTIARAVLLTSRERRRSWRCRIVII